MTLDQLKSDEILSLIAFGMRDSSKAKGAFTVRNALDNPSLLVVKEVPELYGMSFEELSKVLHEHCDIDKEFKRKSLFD